MKIRLIHDLVAFLVTSLIGILVSFYYSFMFSLGVFIGAFSIWLILSCYFITVDFKYALDPRLSRISIGSILLLISLGITLIFLGLESRIIAIVIIIAIILLIMNIYYLSKKPKSK